MVCSGPEPQAPQDQAAAAVRGGWAAGCVVDDAGAAVAMGRVILDGGWSIDVVDMAVLPEHQRRGHAAVLAYLLEQIRLRAPAGAFVSLLADEPGRPLYLRHGFTETAPGSVGMAKLLDGRPYAGGQDEEPGEPGSSSYRMRLTSEDRDVAGAELDAPCSAPCSCPRSSRR